MLEMGEGKKPNRCVCRKRKKTSPKVSHYFNNDKNFFLFSAEVTKRKRKKKKKLPGRENLFQTYLPEINKHHQLSSSSAEPGFYVNLCGGGAEALHTKIKFILCVIIKNNKVSKYV